MKGILTRKQRIRESIRKVNEYRAALLAQKEFFDESYFNHKLKEYEVFISRKEEELKGTRRRDRKRLQFSMAAAIFMLLLASIFLFKPSYLGFVTHEYLNEEAGNVTGLPSGLSYANEMSAVPVGNAMLNVTDNATGNMTLIPSETGLSNGTSQLHHRTGSGYVNEDGAGNTSINIMTNVSIVNTSQGNASLQNDTEQNITENPNQSAGNMSAENVSENFTPPIESITPENTSAQENLSQPLMDVSSVFTNLPPSGSVPALEMEPNMVLTLALDSYFTDAEPLSYSVDENDHLAVSVDGNILNIISGNETGNFTVLLYVSDGFNLVASAVNVEVIGPVVKVPTSGLNIIKGLNLSLEKRNIDSRFGVQVKKLEKVGNLFELGFDKQGSHVDLKGLINISDIKNIRVDNVKSIKVMGRQFPMGTSVVSLNHINITGAEVSLEKSGPVNAIVKCSDYDLDAGACSEWVPTNISFTDNGTHITFNVTSFSGYGGAYITIINVQSYPMVGGNWTVRFNTTGVANLTITTINRTTFGNSAPDDLEWLQLRCDDQVLNASFNGTHVFYPDWNCSGIGKQIVHVMTEGSHHQMFTFGNETAFANNYAHSGNVYNCTSCADCTSAIADASAGDIVRLTQNVSTTVTCINLAGKQDITFDCLGHKMTGDDGDSGISYGISGVNNVTIKNCVIYNFDRGLNFVDADYVTLANLSFISTESYALFMLSNDNYWDATNLTFTNNHGQNLDMRDSTHNRFSGYVATNTRHTGLRLSQNDYNNSFEDVYINRITVTGYSGVFVGSSSDYNNFTNIHVNDVAGGNGIYFSQSDHNILDGANVNNADYSSNDGVGILFWHADDTIIRNVWVNDTEYQGIKFWEGSDNNQLFNFSIGYAQDLGMEIHEYGGSTPNLNNTITGGVIHDCDDDGFLAWTRPVRMSDVVSYNNTGNGFTIQEAYGCDVSNLTAYGNSQDGIYFLDTSNSNLTGLNSYGNFEYGFRMFGNDYDNTVKDSRFTGNSQAGIYLMTDGSYTYDNYYLNNFFNNTVNVDCDYDGSGHTGFWNTSLDCGAGPNIVGGNCMGGNYWADPSGTGWSQTCDDDDGNGICDDQYDILTDNTDYLPLVFQPAYNLSITDPTTSSPVSVLSFENITITFNMTSDSGSEITSGVSVINVTIGGVDAPVIGTGGAVNVQFRNYSSNFSNSASSLTVSKPSGTVEGDLLVAWLTHDDAGTLSDASAPDGSWTQMAYPGTISAFDSHSWYKTASDSEPSTYTFSQTSGSANDIILHVAAFYNTLGIGTWTLEDSLWNFSGNTIAKDTITVTGVDDGVLVVGFGNDGARTVSSAPAGMTKIRTSGAAGCDDTVASASQASYYQLLDAGVVSKSLTWSAVDEGSAMAGFFSWDDSGQLAYVSGVGWQVNVTVPDLSIGLKDLYVNASYNGISSSDTQTNAVNYGVGGGVYYAPIDTTTAQYQVNGSVNSTVDNGSIYSESQVINFTHPTWGKRLSLLGRFSDSDVNLTSLKIYASTTKTAVDLTGVIGTGDNHTIFVPRVYDEGVYVCPDASNLDGVNKSCLNLINFTQQEAVAGTWRDGVYAKTEGSYFRIENLTGSGGGDDGSPPRISFVLPTPDDGSTQAEPYVEINVSINESTLDEFIWNWNGTNYTIMDDSLVGMWNFDNVSALGENDTLVKDVSGNGNDGTCNLASGYCPTFTSSGKYNGAYDFDGVDDYVQYSNFNYVGSDGTVTISVWVNLESLTDDGGIVDIAPQAQSNAFKLGLDASNNIMIQTNFGDSPGGSVIFINSPSLGTWYHYVGVYNGTNLIAYVDGVLANSDVLTGPSSASVPVTIGDDTDGANRFLNGSIDEVRIYNRALSASEVQELYMSNLNKYDTDKWSFYINQTKNATDLLDDGTYTYQGFAKDTSDNWNQTEIRWITIGELPLDMTLNSPANASTVNNSHVLLNATVTDADDDLMTARLYSYYSDEINASEETGLVGLWHFDNDSSMGENDANIYDWSGNGNDGSVMGWNITTANGKFRKAMQFDGADDYIDAGNSSSLSMTNAITVSAWVYPLGANDVWDKVISKGEQTWGLELRTDLDTYGFTVYDTDYRVAYGGNYTIGRWTHLVGTFNGSTVKIYVNGKLSENTTTATAIANPGQYDLDIGRNSAGNQYSNAVIDEVAIYNRSLSAQEIKRLYDKGRYKLLYSGKDLSDGEEIDYNLTSMPLSVQDGMVLLMHFDNDSSMGEDNTHVYDWTGMGNNGTAQDYNASNSDGDTPPLYKISAGKFGGGFTFDGVDDYISTNGELIANEVTFSLMAWINLSSSNGTNKGIYGEGATGSSTPKALLDIDGSLSSTPGLVEYFHRSAGNTMQAYSTVRVDDGIYHLVTVVRINISAVKIYVDGIDRTNQTLIASPTALAVNKFSIGSYVVAGTRLDYFNGTIDEVAIWNRSLSAAEVQALYELGNGRYYWKGNVSDGTSSAESDTWWFELNISDTTPPAISFVKPTPPNATITTNTSVIVNVSINESNLDEFIWNWNGTNYTVMDDSLVLMMNFDNVSSLGENDTYVVDVSGNGNDGVVYGGNTTTPNGKYGRGMQFDSIDDFVLVQDNSSLDITGEVTISAWIYMNALPNAGDWVSIAGKGDNLGPDWNYYIGVYALPGTGETELEFAYTDPGLEFEISTSDLQVGTWYHVVSTYDDDSDTINLYVNGQLQPDDGGASSGSISENDYPLGIGVLRENDGLWDWGYFKGTIDEVQVYNRALSAEEIQELYMSNLNKYAPDKWSFYINQTKNTTAGLDNGTYTYQAFAKDEAGNTNQTEIRWITIGELPLDMTLNSPANASTVNNSHVLLNATVTDADDDLMTARLYSYYSDEINASEETGLVGLWHFDNDSSVGESDTHVYDWSGNGNDGVVTGSIWTDSGKFKGAYKFDGSDDSIDTGYMSSLNNLGEITIAAWVKHDSLTDDDMIVANYNGSDTNGFILFRNEDQSAGAVCSHLVDCYKFQLSSGGHTVYFNTNNRTSIAGEWTFITAVFRGQSQAEIWINGVNQSGCLDNSEGMISDTGDSPTNFTVGSSDALGSSFQFNGSLDEIAIYNRSLSSQEVKRLYDKGRYKLLYSGSGLSNGTEIDYNLTSMPLSVQDGMVLLMHFDNDSGYGESDGLGGNVYDFSGTGNNGTMGNGTTGTDPTFNNSAGKFGGGLQFDGQDDQVEFPTILNNEAEITMSVWVYPKLTDSFSTIVYHGDNGEVAMEATDNTYQISIKLSDDNWYGIGTPVQPNKWSNIVGTWKKGDSIQLYIDGNRINYSSVPDLFLYDPGITYLSSIGTWARGVFGGYFNGTIDEVAIWNRSLSAAEVQALYELQNGRYYWKGNVSDGTDSTESDTWWFELNKPDIINPAISFVKPTPANGTTTSNTSVQINVSINDSDLNEFIWNWNGTNYTVKNNSLVGMWNFDNVSALSESTGYLGTVVDVSGNGNNGTLGNATAGTNPTWTSSGKYGGAFSFDGVNDFIELGTGPLSFVQSNSPFTISLWAKAKDSNQSRILFSKQGAITIWISNHHFIFSLYNTTVGFKYTTDTKTVQINEWTHLTAVYNGTELLFYRDGIFQGSDSCPEGVYNYTGYDTYVGIISPFGYPSSYFFNGSIDEVRIYNTSLSASEVQELYMSNLNKYDTDKWSFYANQSVRDGTYTYQAFAKDEAGNRNQTEERTINVEVAPSVSLDSPLDNWYVNDTIVFDCDATDDTSLKNASLYDNFSGAWALEQTSDIRGISNSSKWIVSGFSNEKSFVWNCYACDSSGNCGWGISNRTLTVDLIGPSVEFVPPTPESTNVTNENHVYVNVSASDASYNLSTFVDWNDSLVGWWRLEQGNGTYFADTSSHGNYGTCNMTGLGCPNVTTGIRGKAYEFDGENDFIEVNDSDELTLSDGFTIALWIRPKIVQNDAQLVIKWNDPNMFEYHLAILSGKIALSLNGDYPSTVNGTTQIPAGKWSFITATWDTANASVYYDGVEEGTGYNNKTMNNTDSDLCIGRKCVGYPALFNGSIDDVMIFNRVLSPEEISGLYNGDGGNNHHNFTGLSEGMYTYRAYAQDMAGNLNNTEGRNITVDMTNPDISFISPTMPNASTTTVPYVIANVSINESNLDIFTWNWNGANYTFMDDSLVGMWNFDNVSALGECTVRNQAGCIKDLSGNGNDGTLGNSTAGTDPAWNDSGRFGGAFDFDGVDDYIELGNPENFPDGAEPRTMCIWEKTSNYTNGAYAFFYGTRAADKAFYVQINKNGIVHGGAWTSDINDTANVSLNTWYHICLTYNGIVMTLYKNGHQAGTPLPVALNLTRSIAQFDVDWEGKHNTKMSIDEARLWNRSLSESEINEVYSSSLRKYDTDKWSFYINQTKNATAGLDDWTYTYQAYAKDEAGNTNQTDKRWITVSTNKAPAVSSTDITPSPAYFNTTFNCSALPIDNESSNINVSFTWFVNGANNNTWDTTVECTNSTWCYTDDYPAGFLKHYNITCSARAFDGSLYSYWKNSSTIEIQNLPPTNVSLIWPNNGNSTLLSRKPNFNWTPATDPENDSLTYEITIQRMTCGSPLGCTVSSLKANTTDTNYTPQTDLDIDSWYNWSVRVYDGEQWSSYSETWNFSILSTSMVALSGTVNFGSLTVNEINDTTDNDPLPFMIENDGNVRLNISIYAQNALWDSEPLGTQYFTFKADNSTETNACAWPLSQVSWAHVDGTTIAQARLAVAYLNFTGNDSVEIDIGIKVPPNEPKGAKSSTIVMEAGYSG